MSTLNKGALRLVDEIIDKSDKLGIEEKKSATGATIIDCGIKVKGSYEAGKYLTEICLARLGKARLTEMHFDNHSLPAISISTDSPALACLGSQMAGWKIKTENYFALGSGPARALAKKPSEVYELLSYSERSNVAVIVLESKASPPDSVLKEIANACHVDAKKLYALVASTTSLAGSTQVSGRVVEAGLHKLLKLGFDVRKTRTACGVAPIAPVISDNLQMMGRVNDMLIAAGQAWYKAEIGKIKIDKLISHVPSSSSKEYGTPFYEILKKAGFDFYNIDPKLFSVAEITITDIKTERKYRAGKLNIELLKKTLQLKG
jgi:methenyltetrahydromethanopterin cyclohydrolase